MKFEGQYRVPARRETVYNKLLDPETLSKALPGCQKLEAEPDGSYKAQMRIGIAAVKGTYQGRVEILDRQPPERLRMKIEGKGAGGFLKGEGRLELGEDGGETVVSYSGEAQVGGLIAAVGQRMMQAAAKQILNQFFDSLVKQVQMS